MFAYFVASPATGAIVKFKGWQYSPLVVSSFLGKQTSFGVSKLLMEVVAFLRPDCKLNVTGMTFQKWCWLLWLETANIRPSLKIAHFAVFERCQGLWNLKSQAQCSTASILSRVFPSPEKQKNSREPELPVRCGTPNCLWRTVFVPPPSAGGIAELQAPRHVMLFFQPMKAFEFLCNESIAAITVWRESRGPDRLVV